MPCCCSQCRPGCGPPSWPACAARTSSSTTAPRAGVEAKAGRKGCTPLSRQTRQTAARVARASAMASPPARCSPAAAASNSAGSDLAAGHQARRHRRRTVPIPGDQDHHTSRAPAHRGDAAPPRPNAGRRRDHRAVARPRDPRHHQQVPPRRHGRSNAAPWTAPHHRTPSPAATGRPTLCSPSSKASRSRHLCRGQTLDNRQRESLRPPARHSSARDIGPHMSNSTYASLADRVHVGAGGEGDVLAGEAGEFGDPQAGLDGEGEHGVVAPAGPGALVARLRGGRRLPRR